MPIQIHGDASFPAQGVVAETLNLANLNGYSTGGTLHLIANNQIGFTTDPADGRSTRYSSDLAKGFDIPIVHVNADDPEAALAAARLALEFRRRFSTDFVIDLVGYRRHGHNEGDEAAYTQPLMAARIEIQPGVREQYAQKLVAAGVISEEDAEALSGKAEQALKDAHERLKATFREGVPAVAYEGRIPSATGAEVVTAVAEDKLRELNEELVRAPDGFTVNPKLVRQLERRRTALDAGGIDWGQAEELAFASLLVEGIPVRLTGQDTERGTFAHRHLVLHDLQTGEAYTPVQNLREAAASLEVHNSPLSEYACVAFEYGYSIAAPESLVCWEAQFGDFVNGAQIAVDQFIVSGLSKWGQTSRLTLLLPHGYEGNGPEHSSARLERFLQLAAQENIRIANCTTAAQYFHLLRRQALDPSARPLVVMTPKGLLRLKEASSTLADLAEGSFRTVIRGRRGRARERPPPRPLLGQVLLRPGRTRAAPRGAVARDRARRAALPLPPDGNGRARPFLPAPRGGRLGAGGTAEHGRVARNPPPARGVAAARGQAPLCGTAVAGEPERGLPHRAPARAGPNRSRGSELVREALG